MKVLVAEDDPVTLRRLEGMLPKWGYEVVSATDGAAAWEILQRGDAPELALLNRHMPGLEGTEICKRIREHPVVRHGHIILLTGLTGVEDIVSGLNSGADDYIKKPFDPEELHARLRAGERVLELRRQLAENVTQFRQALAEVELLHGLLPICMYCKKIRDDQNYWERVESYIEKRANVHFSHGICPDCLENIAKPALEKALRGDSKSDGGQEP